MNISFKIKVIIVFVFLSLVVSFVSLNLMYQKTIKAQMEDLKASLLMTATLGADLIDGDAHKLIPLERASINSSYYQHIKRKLQFIREANPKIRYVYTVTKDKSGRLYFVVDSARIEELFSYPGDSYESLSEGDVLQAFKEPTVNKELIRDTWGSYMSGYAPIYDAGGNAVAVLGLDMSGETIEATRGTVKQNIVTIFIFSILLSVILGVFIAVRLTGPIHTLVEGTKHLAKGDLHYRVHIDSKDELGKLADSFNTMAQALEESDYKLRHSFLETIKALTVALEAKDPYTKGHSERVMKYGAAIARELGISEEEIDNLKYLYIMHDIGKIGIEEQLLNKATELTEAEREILHTHSEIGGEILAPISFLSDQLMQVVRSHHERQDGTGYPEGLREDEIPLAVAILTVADAFDAMVTDRPYRNAYSVEDAKTELKHNIGTHFKKDVVEAFIRLIERGEDMLNDERNQ